MPRTSVLVNNYNNARFLGECVESVLGQTRPADEVIVYDDGSTDDSVPLLRSFGDRITLIEGRRTGLSSRPAQANAVHQAFLRSTGDLVFLLDGDDRFHADKIAAYLACFERHPDAALIQAPMQQIDEEGRPLGSTFHPRKHHDDYLAATYRLHDTDFYYPTSSLALSRGFLVAVLPLNFSDGIELPIDTRLGMVAPLFGRVVSLREPLSDWRRHSSSYTRQLGPRNTQLNETLKRTRVFNAFAATRGRKPISLWRNRRVYPQMLRAAAPEAVFDWYLRVFRGCPPRAE